MNTLKTEALGIALFAVTLLVMIGLSIFCHLTLII